MEVKMLKIYEKMLEGMTRESKVYYISLGVKFGDLTQSQAGYLIYFNKLLK